MRALDALTLLRMQSKSLLGGVASRVFLPAVCLAGCDRTLKAAVMEACARGYRRAGFNEETASILLQRQRELLDMPLR